MTTYSAIADSDIDPDSPITTSLMTRLRDNPIATMEGNASQKIADAAFNTNSINGNKLVTNSVTATQIATSTITATQMAANSVAFSSELNSTTTNWSWTTTDVSEYQTIPAGVMNGFYFSSRPSSGSNEQGAIYLQQNMGSGGWVNVEQFTYTTTDLGGQAYIDRQVVSDGVNCRLYHFHNAGNANNFVLYGRRIYI